VAHLAVAEGADEGVVENADEQSWFWSAGGCFVGSLVVSSAS
jgi:hypothetical protein